MNDPKYHLSTPMGIHRVNMEPYDDREIFLSMESLLEYCKNGARYNGQCVGCIIGDENAGYIQNFTINNSYPIIDFNSGELITHKTNKNYALVYYYNPAYDDSAMFDSSLSHLNYLSNAFHYSILELLDAFRSSIDSDLSFLVERTDLSTGITKTSSWSQTFHPIREHDTTITESVYIKYVPDSISAALWGVENTEKYNIIPKIPENIITAIYIYCPGYINAAKGVK